MFVWRIEHPSDNKGPYRCLDESVRDFVRRLEDAATYESHPTPVSDGIPGILLYDEKWVCGFSHLESLRTWFAGWFEEMHRHGFVLTKWKVKKALVVQGGRQCVFNREGAHLIKKECLPARLRAHDVLYRQALPNLFPRPGG